MRKIDVVVIFNGLGNQMSQYAFFLAKKRINENTFCIYHDSFARHNGYELKKLFDIEPESNERLEKLLNFLLGKTLFSKIIRRILSMLYIYRFYFEDTNTYDFDEKFLKKGKGIINIYMGGWHSPLYFKSMEMEIKEKYTFKSTLIDTENKQIVENMKKENSVSIHIRRGDYLAKINSKYNVTNLNYYNDAIELLRQYYFKNSKITYYVFSDDMDWVKENLKLENAVYVSWNKGNNSWKDMYLMSNCKANINPNSTFSWWASYLNMNETPTVIVPDCFIVGHKALDFYQEDWIKLAVK